MKKTLYSLMLNDDVIREIDLLARQRRMNRSSLVNRILAEYVHFETPEQRIDSIFRQMDELMASSEELVSFFTPNSNSFSLKSSLDYKYRPTLRYEVELESGGRERLGTLDVIFRTQSETLIASITDFLRYWKRLEDAFLAPKLDTPIDYALYEGRFQRSLARPGRDCTSQELAEAFSRYIRLFDQSIKQYLAGGASEAGIQEAYLDALKNAELTI